MKRTFPRALMTQERPSSPAAALADSGALFTSAAAETAGADSAAAVRAGGEIDAGATDFCESAIEGLGSGTATRCPPATAAATAASCGGGCDAAGRRRRRISLASGPAAGTRSSASRWRMRSALICWICVWKGAAWLQWEDLTGLSNDLCRRANKSQGKEANWGCSGDEGSPPMETGRRNEDRNGSRLTLRTRETSKIRMEGGGLLPGRSASAACTASRSPRSAALTPPRPAS